MTKTPTRTSPYPKRTPLKVYPIFNFKNDPEFRKSAKSPKSETKKVRKPKLEKTPKTPKTPKNKSRDDQYVIDAGQKDFDASQCKTCNMLYTKGAIEDEEHHSRFHENFVNSIRYRAWKTENTWKQFDDESKIVVIRPDDPKFMLKKVDEMFTIADQELGINVSLFDCLKPDMVFLLYVSNGRICGFVVGEPIKEANMYCPDTGMVNIIDSFPCDIGVPRIWIHFSYRRKGIGTKLLDALRAIFGKENAIDKLKIAFTDPTEEGLAFISTYTGRRNILVYTL